MTGDVSVVKKKLYAYSMEEAEGDLKSCLTNDGVAEVPTNIVLGFGQQNRPGEQTPGVACPKTCYDVPHALAGRTLGAR
jgi:hypothetical protein